MRARFATALVPLAAAASLAACGSGDHKLAGDPRPRARDDHQPRLARDHVHARRTGRARALAEGVAARRRPVQRCRRLRGKADGEARRRSGPPVLHTRLGRARGLISRLAYVSDTRDIPACLVLSCFSNNEGRLAEFNEFIDARSGSVMGSVGFPEGYDPDHLTPRADRPRPECFNDGRRASLPTASRSAPCLLVNTRAE